MALLKSNAYVDSPGSYYDAFELDLDIDWNNETLSSPSSDLYTDQYNSSSTDSLSSPSPERFDEFDDNDTVMISNEPKKRRIRDRRRILIPKVLKYDVRRFYTQMFANAMNSADAVFMQAFLDSYSLPSVQMKKETDASACQRVQNDPRFGIPKRESMKHTQKDMEVNLQGTQNIAQYWSFVFSMSADTVVSISDTKVVSRINTTASTVTCNFQVRFTKTFHIDLFAAMAINDNQDSNSFASAGGKRSRELDKTEQSAMVIQRLIETSRTTQNVTPLPQPVPIKITGKLTMQLDEAKRIQFMNFGQPVMAF